MKFDAIFLVLCINHHCNATILVKFGMVVSHYIKNAEKGASRNDPLEYFGLHSRQILCDVAINAKQFILKYPTLYYKGRSGKPVATFTQWDPLDSVLDRSMNYQRALASQNDSHSSCLTYLSRTVAVHRDPWYVKMKSLQCVNTMHVKWFLTFGHVDHYMYLLEPGEHKKAPALRMTGIFEPSAIVENRTSKYFRRKFKTSVDKMESFCRLGVDNHLRLCSTVFDALNKENDAEQEQEYYVFIQNRGRSCASRDVKESESHKVRSKVVSCTILRGNGISIAKRFFLLADSGDRSAVFVLFETRKGALELNARVIKIGALLNPTSRKLTKSDVSEDEGVENESLEERSLSEETQTDSDVEQERPKDVTKKEIKEARSEEKRLSAKKVPNPMSSRMTTEEELKRKRSHLGNVIPNDLSASIEGNMNEETQTGPDVEQKIKEEIKEARSEEKRLSAKKVQNHMSSKMTTEEELMRKRSHLGNVITKDLRASTEGNTDDTKGRESLKGGEKEPQDPRVVDVTHPGLNENNFFTHTYHRKRTQSQTKAPKSKTIDRFALKYKRKKYKMRHD